MSTHEPDAIVLTREAGVATITLNRPKVMNALTPELFSELAERFDEVAANPEDRVCILTGSGGAFCGGADLSGGGEQAKRLGNGPIARQQFTRETLLPALKLHRLPKPTIAAVNGVAAGGGCNLALGCDVVKASDRALHDQDGHESIDERGIRGGRASGLSRFRRFPNGDDRLVEEGRRTIRWRIDRSLE